MDTRERKKINFSYDGSDYTLEYTVESIRKMERDGFDFTKMEDHVVNIGFDMFAGAFIAKHNYVPREQRDKMYMAVMNENENGESLLGTLAEMLKDELEWIVNKPQGNVSWTVV